MSSNSCAAYSRLQNRAMGRPDPQGSVCGQPRRAPVVLRSSPLICAVDDIFLLVKWLSVMWLGHGPVSAARRVWCDRSDDQPAPGTDRLWIVSTSAFILAVVQGAKIFGTTGVPGTQALIVLFLAAYAIPEAFRMAFGSTDVAAANNSPAVVDRGFETIKYHLYPVETASCLLAGITHVSIALWIIARSIPACMFVSVHRSHGAADNLEMTPTSLSIYALQPLRHPILPAGTMDVVSNIRNHGHRPIRPHSGYLVGHHLNRGIHGDRGAGSVAGLEDRAQQPGIPGCGGKFGGVPASVFDSLPRFPPVLSNLLHGVIFFSAQAVLCAEGSVQEWCGFAFLSINFGIIRVFIRRLFEDNPGYLLE
ncbi:hypothetical protein QBC37DRAFT_404819 [Rhypophila decipiens]|uniref:Uncharacterized protein n=1 Tax=Rhypophila decipiens TaxID=261697 RepID=A0AAN7B3I4_9PEZI|nr:hypothetical protein QBC37DRAFT_404819 [Rhypophila decipiens]